MEQDQKADPWEVKMRIEVYVLCSKSPGIMKNAKAKWAVAAFEDGPVDESALIWKRDGVVVSPNATNKKASLVALRDALKRFTKPAVINLYVQDPFVKNMLQNNMPYRWSTHDWRLFRYNREIKYCSLWQEIYGLLSNHAVKYARSDELAGKKLIKDMEVT